MLEHKINKEFSNGFIKDLADIIDSCIENHTDGGSIKLEFNSKILNAFSIMHIFKSFCQFISNKPLEIDLLRLSFIIDGQKKLIDELITLLNTSDLTTGYKRKMLKCIREGLIDALNLQVHESKSATHKRRA